MIRTERVVQINALPTGPRDLVRGLGLMQGRLYFQ